MTDDPRNPGFTDETLKRVLERAIELDTLAKSRVSEAELRAIASEIGVSTTSLDAALEELRAPHVEPTAVPNAEIRRPAGSLLKAAASGATGAVVMIMSLRLGGLNGLPAHFFLGLSLAGAAVAGASVFAALRARHRKPADFHSWNSALWFGAFVGLTFMGRLFPSSNVIIRVSAILLVQGWIASTAIGAIIGAVKWRARSAGSNPSAGPPSDGPGPSSSDHTQRRRTWRDWFTMPLHWFEFLRRGWFQRSEVFSD